MGEPARPDYDEAERFVDLQPRQNGKATARGILDRARWLEAERQKHLNQLTSVYDQVEALTAERKKERQLKEVYLAEAKASAKVCAAVTVERAKDLANLAWLADHLKELWCNRGTGVQLTYYFPATKETGTVSADEDTRVESLRTAIRMAREEIES